MFVGDYDFYVILILDFVDFVCCLLVQVFFFIIFCDDLGNFIYIDFDDNGMFDGLDVLLL